jgi:hypothetical protein
LGEFATDGHESSSKQSVSSSQSKKLTKREFDSESSPVPSGILKNIYTYVRKLVGNRYPWQVASSFVTHILNINEQELSNEGTRIKILKPAEDFYEKLIIGWLMLIKCQKNKNIDF